jgi:hypothetical protein
MQFPAEPFPMPVTERITARGIYGCGDGVGYLGAAAAAAWPTANMAILQPFRVAHPFTTNRMETINGGTVSGNIDVGIYSADGKKLTSIGSTAQTGTSASQNFNYADYKFAPGLYFMAIAMNNTTGQLDRWNISAHFLRAMGVYKMASAFPLPDVITFEAMSVAYLPHAVMFRLGDVMMGLPSYESVLVPSQTIHPYSREAVGAAMLNFGCGDMTANASAGWPSANASCSVPFNIQKTTRFRSIWCANGSVVSGNIDLGIYRDTVRIASTGSTAQSGTTTIQVVALDVTLTPGQYWMTLGCSNTTAQFIRCTSPSSGHFAPQCNVFHLSNFPLGATITAGTFFNYQPLFGLCRSTVL